jgi:hypothetical protein
MILLPIVAPNKNYIILFDNIWTVIMWLIDAYIIIFKQLYLYYWSYIVPERLTNFSKRILFYFIFLPPEITSP